MKNSARNFVLFTILSVSTLAANAGIGIIDGGGAEGVSSAQAIYENLVAYGATEDGYASAAIVQVTNLKCTENAKENTVVCSAADKLSNKTIGSAKAGNTLAILKVELGRGLKATRTARGVKEYSISSLQCTKNFLENPASVSCEATVAF